MTLDLELDPKLGHKKQTVSEMRRLLARTLSKMRGDLIVTKFSFQVSIQDKGFKSGD